MALHLMVSREDFEANPENIKVVSDYPGAKGPLYMKTSFVGCVVNLREMNGYDDSDFYATVWDADQQRFREIEYGTTRFWTYPNHANIDGTPEVMERYKAHLEAVRQYGNESLHQIEIADPTVGKTVDVIGGRKHKGKTGRIFWRGANQFRTYYRNGYNRPDAMSNQRLGIETESGEKFFIPAEQVKVIGSRFTPEEAAAKKKVVYASIGR